MVLGAACGEKNDNTVLHKNRAFSLENISATRVFEYSIRGQHAGTAPEACCALCRKKPRTGRRPGLMKKIGTRWGEGPTPRLPKGAGSSPERCLQRRCKARCT